MEQMINASIQLRDLIETDIQNTANDLEAQRLATNYAFRNRIHEVWKANWNYCIPKSRIGLVL